MVALTRVINQDNSKFTAGASLPSNISGPASPSQEIKDASGDYSAETSDGAAATKVNELLKSAGMSSAELSVIDPEGSLLPPFVEFLNNYRDRRGKEGFALLRQHFPDSSVVSDKEITDLIQKAQVNLYTGLRVLLSFRQKTQDQMITITTKESKLKDAQLAVLVELQTAVNTASKAFNSDQNVTTKLQSAGAYKAEMVDAINRKLTEANFPTDDSGVQQISGEVTKASIDSLLERVKAQVDKGQNEQNQNTTTLQQQSQARTTTQDQINSLVQKAKDANDTSINNIR